VAFNSERQIKRTRKPHKCHGCSQAIPVGSAARYLSGTDGGELYSCHLCSECVEYIDKYGWDDVADVDGALWEGAVAEARRDREAS